MTKELLMVVLKVLQTVAKMAVLKGSSKVALMVVQRVLSNAVKWAENLAGQKGHSKVDEKAMNLVGSKDAKMAG